MVHSACAREKTEVIKTLINIGANIEAIDPIYHGWTPLHWAVVRNNMEIVLMLLENGADLDASDHFNDSTLHWAIQKDNCQMSELLLKCGVSLGKRNVDGNNALEYSLQKREKGIDFFKIMSFQTSKYLSGYKQTLKN